VDVANSSELVDQLRGQPHDVTIRLAPGRYEVPPQNEPGTAPAGLLVSGRNVRIIGDGPEDVVINTVADCVIRFENCDDCEIDNVRVAGNISVGGGSVHISNCVVDNGIQAVHGDFVIESNEISSSWDGIDLANAHAVVANNLIVGLTDEHDANVDAGVRIRGDATVSMKRNHIRGFPAGLALMWKASVDCTANIIEDIDGIGIDGTDGGLGRITIRENAIYRCGSPGIAIWADGDQQATRNLIVSTGRSKPREGAVLALGSHADAAIRKNTLYDNTVTNPGLDRDVSREAFWRARRPWTRTYRNTAVGVDGRHRFYESAFLTRYGRWAD